MEPFQEFRELSSHVPFRLVTVLESAEFFRKIFPIHALELRKKVPDLLSFKTQKEEAFFLTILDRICDEILEDAILARDLSEVRSGRAGGRKEG